jgi:SAM-dependent methyltransferase
LIIGIAVARPKPEVICVKPAPAQKSMPHNNDALNQRFYQSHAIADWYATKDFTLPEEQAFLAKHGHDMVSGKQVLDIGIGAGRTTRFLLPQAARYVGVDYSPAMIAAARGRFPEASLDVRDARDLSAYVDGEFDTVIFSFNGMDCLSHKGRLSALSEIHRVLKPGGGFIFSSHNRDRPAVSALATSNISFSKHPVHMGKNLCRYLRGIVNWLRTRSLAHEDKDFALRHDSGNVYEAPTYYINKDSQSEQLARCGFALTSVFDGQGGEASVAEPDTRSAWILFVCCKAATMDTRQQ